MQTFSHLVEIINNTNDFDQLSLDDLISVLSKCDDLYFEDDGESPLDDSKYDSVRRFVHLANPTNEYFIGVGSRVRGDKVDLPYSMGSLDQVYEGEMPDWISKNKLKSSSFSVSDKLDGISGLVCYNQSCNFQIAFSRGDGIQGADISRHASRLCNMPQQVKTKGLVVRGEIIIERVNDFGALQKKVKTRAGKEYKNPRNMVAGLMNAKTNPDFVYNHVRFVAYEVVYPKMVSKAEQLKVLHESGFEVVHAEETNAKTLTDHVLTQQVRMRKYLSQYELDGLVIEVNDDTDRKRLTPTRDTLNPGYAVKYKVMDESNIAVAEVVKVHWKLSKSGYFKPRVEIRPVDLVGVTITYATGFNAKFIVDNNIGPGAQVKITRSGDVIPFIIEVPKASPTGAQLPDEQSVWNETGVDLIVENADEHTDVILQQTIDFFASLDIPGLKAGNITKIVDEHESSFSAIISLLIMNKGDWVDEIGRNGSKIYDGIQNKMKTIQLFEFMGALPCFGRGVGVRKFKKLQEAFGADGLFNVSDSASIVAVDGFEEKTATKIINGMDAFHNMVNILRNEGFALEFTEEKKADGVFSGQVFCFTGFRNKTLQEKIEAEGGEVASSVTKKVTCVVAADPNSNSGKVKKARDAGLKIVGMDDLVSQLGEPKKKDPVDDLLVF